MKTLLLSILVGTILFAGDLKGTPAKTFNLKTLDGTQTYNMKSFKGQVVLLNLWASWCKGCKKEMPEFFKLQKSYKSGFKIVTISVDDNAEKSKKFLHALEKKMGYKTPFITLHDTQKSVVKAYNCAAMPSSYLIDKHGVIQEVIIGSLNADDIERLKSKINTLK